MQSQFENCLQRVQCKTHVHISSHTFILIRTKLTLQSCLADALLFTGSFSPSLRLWPSFNTFLCSFFGSARFSWDSIVSQSKFASASVHSVGLCLYVFDRVTVFSEFFCFALACLWASICISFLLVLYVLAGFFYPLFLSFVSSLTQAFILPSPWVCSPFKGALKGSTLNIFCVKNRKRTNLSREWGSQILCLGCRGMCGCNIIMLQSSVCSYVRYWCQDHLHTGGIFDCPRCLELFTSPHLYLNTTPAKSDTHLVFVLYVLRTLSLAVYKSLQLHFAHSQFLASFFYLHLSPMESDFSLSHMFSGCSPFWLSTSLLK